MRIPLLFILMLFLFLDTFSQEKIPFAAKGTKTKKRYDINLSYSYDGAKSVYKVNKKIVTKRFYKKMKRKRGPFRQKKYTRCKPCLFKDYNEYDTISSEFLYYYGEGTIWFKRYHSNGAIKELGFYKKKDNTKNSWRTAKDSTWTYWDNKGNMIYKEYWNKGEFVKQEPEQNRTEFSDIEFIVGAKKTVYNDTVFPEDLKILQIIPKFKNSIRDSLNLRYEASISVFASKYYGVRILSFNGNNLDSINLYDSLKLKSFHSTERLTVNITLFNEKTFIEQTTINIINNFKPVEDGQLSSYEEKEFQHTSKIKLVNSFDSTKTLSVPYYSNFEIILTDSITDTTIISATKTLHGFIKSVNPNNIVFDKESENKYLKYKNGDKVSISTNTYYNSTVSIPNNSKLEATLDRQSNGKEWLGTFSGYTAFVSGLTGLIVAPLVSINYKNWDFNQKRYYKVAGAGLIGVGICIPIMRLTQSKTYNITFDKKIKDKDLWRVENDY